MVNSRPPANNLPRADQHRGNSFRSTLGRNGEMEHALKKMHQAPSSILDETKSRVAHRRTYHTRQGRSGYGSSEKAKGKAQWNSGPNTSSRGDCRSPNSSTIISMRNPKARGNHSARQDSHAGQALIPSGDADRSPNVLWNSNRDPNTSGNPNRNPDSG